MSVRLSVNIADDTAEALRRYMAQHGCNATDAVRNMIAYGAEICRVADDRKAELLVVRRHKWRPNEWFTYRHPRHHPLPAQLPPGPTEVQDTPSNALAWPV